MKNIVTYASLLAFFTICSLTMLKGCVYELELQDAKNKQWVDDVNNNQPYKEY